jgi:nucleotide-binding universal stress UspA family protein
VPLFPTRILVGIDHAPTSTGAVTAATELARTTGSELHLLHVKTTSSTVRGRPVTPGQGDRMEAEAATLLAAATDVVHQHGGEVTATHVRFGEQVGRVLAQAQGELEAGLLVVGSGPRGSTARTLLAASPASGVVRRAPGSVLVVRDEGTP